MAEILRHDIEEVGGEIESKTEASVEDISAKLIDIGKKIKACVDTHDQEGAKAIFNEFIEQSTPIVRNYFQKIDRNMSLRSGVRETYYASLIDDAMQEAYISIFDHFYKFNSNLPIMGWLYVIARNSYITQIRKKTFIDKNEQDQDRAQISLSKDIEDKEPDMMEQIAQQEVMGIIKNIIAGIPSENLRKTAELMYLEELSAEAVMEKLNITRLNYNQRVVRIRREIAKVLKDTGFDNIDSLTEEMRQQEMQRDKEGIARKSSNNQSYADCIRELVAQRGE